MGKVPEGSKCVIKRRKRLANSAPLRCVALGAVKRLAGQESEHAGGAFGVAPGRADVRLAGSVVENLWHRQRGSERCDMAEAGGLEAGGFQRLARMRNFEKILFAVDSADPEVLIAFAAKRMRLAFNAEAAGGEVFGLTRQDGRESVYKSAIHRVSGPICSS